MTKRNKIEKPIIYTATCGLMAMLGSSSGVIMLENNSSPCCASIWQYDNKKVTPAKEISRLGNRLSYLKRLYAEIGEVSILNQSEEKVLKLFSCIPDRLFEKWELFVNDKGALTLEYKGGVNKAVICVGESQVSFFEMNDNNLRVTGVAPFSMNRVMHILEDIQNG